MVAECDKVQTYHRCTDFTMHTIVRVLFGGLVIFYSPSLGHKCSQIKNDSPDLDFRTDRVYTCES